jgi:hypothetical protein
MIDCKDCYALQEELDAEKRASQMLRKAILALVNKSMDGTLFDDGEEVISMEDIM